MEKLDIKEFVSNWNRECPIDRWWRNKHNISFNSPSHRTASFIDMYIEFQEYLMFERNIFKKEEKEVDKYKVGGSFLIERTYDQKELDDIFDNLKI